MEMVSAPLKPAKFISFIQWCLLFLCVASIGLVSLFESFDLFMLPFGLLALIFVLNILRYFRGCNLFLLPKYVEHRGLWLIFSLCAIIGIFIISFGQYLLGVIISLLSILLAWCTRCGVWHVFEAVKTMEKEKLRENIFPFLVIFSAVLALFSIIPIWMKEPLAFFLIIPVAWVAASYTLGMKSMGWMKEEMARQADEQQKSLAEAALTATLHITTLGQYLHYRIDPKEANSIVAKFTTHASSPIIGSLLAVYIFIQLIKKNKLQKG